MPISNNFGLILEFLEKKTTKEQLIFIELAGREDFVSFKEELNLILKASNFH